MEITTSNILHSGTNINSITFDRMGAEAIYRFLLELGATKDIKFEWDENHGKIHIMKKFVYQTDDDGTKHFGDQFYTLSAYIRLLIRFDRAAYNRLKNVENKINRMYNGIEALKKQL